MLLGILLVLVVIGGFFLYNGGRFGGPASTTHTVNLNVTAPAKPGG
jgi:hypothetical protein